MRKLILTLTLVLLSCNVSAEKNEFFKDCKKLKNEIEFNIYNYFANFEKENLRKYPDHKERAEKFLDIANKQASVYNAICDD